MHTETHSFDTEVSKLLHLVIHSLYTNKDIALRELISNAADACDKLRYLSQTDDTLLCDNPVLRITLHSDETARTLTVRDTGIGMSQEELITNLGTIAHSGTGAFLSQLGESQRGDTSLIGQFGVGFYAAFMIADRVRVVSRRAREKTAHAWESDGSGTFTIQEVEGDTPRGTEVTLFLREDAGIYTDPHKIKHIVTTYSDHLATPVVLVKEDSTEETLTRGTALWTRPKSEITEEQYESFYRSVSFQPGTPSHTLHWQVEGAVSYTALLFVPGERPFDLFHPDRRRRVKLYVRRVFIADEGMELVPHWLRFVRGVVDSEDLPLNVSRETLQHTPVIAKIRQSIEKKILSELAKQAEKDETAYLSFWERFGSVLKEGLCDSFAERPALLSVCRFASTHSETGVTGLQAYKARMQEGQEAIYYLTGDSREALSRSPALEGFKKRGIEVLLLTDPVDDFWVNAVSEYEGTPIQSVSRAVLTETPETTSEDNTDSTCEMDTLIAVLKAIFGTEVKDVRTTGKLSESPVCLAVGEQDMDIRLERFLVENKQLAGFSARILEVNPNHPVVQALATRATCDGADHPTVRDMAYLLLDQARVAEGEPVPDTQAFARRLNWLMRERLAA
jgi:molecular chaperone HtpG